MLTDDSLLLQEEQAKQKDRRRGREKPFLPSTDALRISRFPDIGKRQRGPETAPEVSSCRSLILIALEHEELTTK